MFPQSCTLKPYSSRFHTLFCHLTVNLLDLHGLPQNAMDNAGLYSYYYCLCLHEYLLGNATSGGMKCVQLACSPVSIRDEKQVEENLRKGSEDKARTQTDETWKYERILQDYSRYKEQTKDSREINSQQNSAPNFPEWKAIHFQIK